MKVFSPPLALLHPAQVPSCCGYSSPFSAISQTDELPWFVLWFYLHFFFTVHCARYLAIFEYSFPQKKQLCFLSYVLSPSTLAVIMYTKKKTKIILIRNSFAKENISKSQDKICHLDPQFLIQSQSHRAPNMSFKRFCILLNILLEFLSSKTPK